MPTKEELIIEGLLTLLQMVDRLVAAHATTKAEADTHAATVEDLRSKLTAAPVVPAAETQSV